jgi:hypothetical protein
MKMLNDIPKTPGRLLTSDTAKELYKALKSSEKANTSCACVALAVALKEPLKDFPTNVLLELAIDFDLCCGRVAIILWAIMSGKITQDEWMMCVTKTETPEVKEKVMDATKEAYDELIAKTKEPSNESLSNN